MGCVYRRKVRFCETCQERLDRTAQQARCESAGHGIRIRETPTWWIKYLVDGRPRCESSHSSERAKAVRLLRRREGDLERGAPMIPGAGLVRFEEAVDDLLNDFRLNRRSTLDDVEARIRLHLRPVFRGRLLARIVTDEIVAYTVARRAAGAADATINRELAVLKRMYSLARERRKLFAEHIPDIPMLPEHNVRTGFFEHDEYRRVLAHLPDALRGIVTFAYVTGWRIQSEILTLEWRQVDRAVGEVRLDPGTTKNREGRVIYLSPELEDVMAEQWRQHEALAGRGIICPYVFHRDGQPIKSIRSAWETACRRAGCPGRIPHDLRRTAVRNMVRAGIPERVAMQVSGHKTRSVFERYNVVSDGDLRAAARQLGHGYTSGDTRAVGAASETQISKNTPSFDPVRWPRG